MKRKYIYVMFCAILLKVTHLHVCFLRFLNCINGTKSRNASHYVYFSWNFEIFCSRGKYDFDTVFVWWIFKKNRSVFQAQSSIYDDSYGCLTVPNTPLHSKKFDFSLHKKWSFPLSVSFSFLWISSHLLKKSLMEHFIFVKCLFVSLNFF